MEVPNGKRITYKRARPNPLFQDWLEELYKEAKAKKSKLETILGEALTSISKYPLPLRSGAECGILKGFDRRLCIFLDKRLEWYNEQNTAAQNNIVNDSQSLNSSDASNARRVLGPKVYKPAFRSGGYAILIALHEYENGSHNKPALTKDELIELAQPHCEESFTRKKPETFYTAWSNMSKLVSKGLVKRVQTKKVVFSLTPQGKKFASQLLIEYSSRISVNDVIFRSPPNAIATSSPAKSTPDIEDSNNLIENGSSPIIDINTPVVEQKPMSVMDDVEEAVKSPSSLEIQEQHTEKICYINLPAGSFDVILLIDKHEVGGGAKKNDATVAQFNKYPDLKHEFRSLKVGDFTWIVRDKSSKDQELILPYIVERKRMDDLGHSIKDGRFHEQKYRLRRCSLKNVLFLVENFGSNKYVGLPIQSLMQALANTRVQDGFQVHVTDSLTNTARFLAMMTKRLTVEYQDKNLKGYHGETRDDCLMTFDFFNKASTKTKTLTVTESFLKLLLQLKGVSVDKALAITQVYKTPLSLFRKYSTCSSKEGEMLLSNLKFGDLNRSVGPSVSKAIFNFFTK